MITQDEKTHLKHHPVACPGWCLCHGCGMVAARQFPYLRDERAGYRFSLEKSSDFQIPQMFSRWWFHFFYFHPYLGK